MNARYLSRRLRRFVRAREAVSTLEYAMLVGLMAVAVGAAIVTFSNDVQTAILNIGDGVVGGRHYGPDDRHRRHHRKLGRPFGGERRLGRGARRRTPSSHPRSARGSESWLRRMSSRHVDRTPGLAAECRLPGRRSGAP